MSMNSDFLEQYKDCIDFEALKSCREKSHKQINRPFWEKTNENIAKICLEPSNAGYIVDNSEIVLPTDLSSSDEISNLIRDLIPWRTGPFKLADHFIDAEWKSGYKWDRLSPHLGDIESQKILDVGCNTGYFLYRLMKHNPYVVLGVDTSERCYQQFRFLQKLSQVERMLFELMGLEDLEIFKNFFDTVICFGVLYHRRDPLRSLRILRDTIKPQGTMFLETIVIPGDDDNVLCVKDRYAMMNNVYLLPTLSSLQIWLERSSFQHIEVIDVSNCSVEEQRKTDYAPYMSLEEFLSEDRTQTVEGYPAPIRAMIKARRMNL